MKYINHGEIHNVLSVGKTQQHSGSLLQPYEIEALKQIEIHRFMLSTDLIKLLQCLRVEAGYPEQESLHVRQRLLRLADAGIIVLKQDAERSAGGLRFSSYMYRLGLRGYRALGFVEGDIDKFKNRYNTVRDLELPSDHNHAATTLMVNTYIALKKKHGDFREFPIIERGSSHELFKNNATTQLQRTNVVVPDYMITHDNIYIAIEVDSGAQRGEHIKNKIKKYERYLKTNPLPMNKKLFIVFSAIESVIAQRVVKDRSNRVLTLKEKVSFDLEWPKIPNVHVYCLASTAVPKMIYEILMDATAISSSFRPILSNSWLGNFSNLFRASEMYLEQFDESAFQSVSYKWEKEYSADLYFSVKPTYDKKHIYFVMYTDSGSSREYRRFHVNIQRIKSLNRKAGIGEVYHLLLLYQTKELMEVDILKPQRFKDVSVVVAYINDEKLRDYSLYNNVYEVEQLPLYTYKDIYLQKNAASHVTEGVDEN